MRLLLDTHVALWALLSPERFPQRVKELILHNDSSIFVSAVTIWEIAIKRPLNRVDAPQIGASDAISEFEKYGFTLIDVTPRHAAMVETLPLRHGDPFDRLLIAQALTEPMRLVTHDKKLTTYSDTIISW